MPVLICPTCRAPLRAGEKSFTCPNGHSFDRAKQGYVNLLMSQSAAAKRHGDDALMVRARTDFLSTGAYRPLLEAICRAAVPDFPAQGVLLDAGCGEGYYTAGVWEALLTAGKYCEAVGTDISKAALKAACRRETGICWAVSSVNALPLAAGSADLLLNCFAPCCEKEFFRVLRKNGRLVRVLPAERHLFSLKKAVYDVPYENPPVGPALFGFTLCGREDLKYTIPLAGGQIKALFEMTPYYYKTAAADFKKLDALDTLTAEAEFAVLTYRKA